MKRQMQVIMLIVFTAMILVKVRLLNKEQLEKESKICMAACSESVHNMVINSWNISEAAQHSLTQGMYENFDIMLEWFQDWYESLQDEYWQEAILYQLAVPCHFFINEYSGKDPFCTYEYRNIDENDEMLWNEEGRINMIPAYLADVIIDTYIREYGGEDTQYHIVLEVESWKEPELLRPDIDFMKIYNDNVTLNVIWDGYLQGAVSVYIEDCDGAEVQDKHLIEYVYHMDVERYYDYAGQTWDNAYCMFIDPEAKQKEYHYRNVRSDDAVSEESTLICDPFGYAIADMAIDKYIRDWGGSDILYDVKLISKIKDEEKGVYHYTLSVMDKEEEVFRIEYTEKEWFVMVNICNQ